jgi:mRNA interferase RelE/StbE
MDYSILLRPAALRDLKSLSPDLQRRVESAIDALANNARPPGCKKLAGFQSEWRLRVGDYRVLYLVDDKLGRVTVARAAHRREAYR